MKYSVFDEHILYHDSSTCPLGSLSLIVSVQKAPGVTPVKPLRIYGNYATVYVTRGQGAYSDANGCEQIVAAGDVMFIFPELPHVYSPDPGTDWDEIYTVFNGPIFDSFRDLGILDASQPVRKGLPASEWLAALTTIAEIAREGDPTRKAMQICRFLELLTEVLGAGNASTPRAPHASQWVSRACRLLASDLGDHATIEEIAAQMGMTADWFRKRFKKEIALSPREYRNRKRIEIACQLLSSTTMTHAQIALYLGFTDEFHFSKRFRLVQGESPRAFRRRRSDQGL